MVFVSRWAEHTSGEIVGFSDVTGEYVTCNNQYIAYTLFDGPMENLKDTLILYEICQILATHICHDW